MAIYGYSERGIINSLIFSLGNNIPLMKKFIDYLKIPHPFAIGEPVDFDILLEQSFSEFGNADLVINIKYNNPENNKVLFIEGKVKTAQKKHWSLEKQFYDFEKKTSYQGYSSNLFFQLHLKKLMMEKKDFVLKESIKEPRINNWRKIGNNKIVWKAFEMIKNSTPHYIGIVPSNNEEIEKFKRELNKINSIISIANDMHFVSWKTIKQFTEIKEYESKFNNVKLNFEFNEGQIYNE